MARRKRVEDQPIGVGMTAKQMKRKKPISSDLMREIEPLTDNQKLLYKSYEKNQGTITPSKTSLQARLRKLPKELRGSQTMATPGDLKGATAKLFSS